jgi:hypothetical protein
MLNWIGWFISRMVVTLICIFSVYNVVNKTTSYNVSLDLLLIVAFCTIVAVRAWMPSCHCHKDQNGKH